MFGSPRTNASFGGIGFADQFPNPFIDVATLSMPRSMRNALYYAEFIMSSQGTLRMAMERVMSYFLTDIEFSASDSSKNDRLSDDEREKWQAFSRDTLDIFTNLRSCYMDRMTYGNSFTSLLVPFKRFLACPKCGSTYPLKVVYENSIFAFAWSDSKFTASCPSCKTGSGYRGPWRVDDKPDDEERKIRIKRWNPHEMELLHDYYTDQTAYLWRIPEDYKQQIRRGTLYHLERIPLPVLDAIQHNQMFRFDPEVIYHMREPTLAGIRNRGWGLPRILTNFRQIYYVQVLRRYNEAIALDYVIPFRLITPAPRPGGSGGGGLAGQMSDPMLAFNMNDFRSQVTGMLRRRRRDPAGWNMLPFPVQYQALGGDASKLAPVELIANGTEQLLNDVGVPIELYKGTLQLQTAPPALRLFEATWQPMVHDGNAWLRWLSRQVGQVLGWEPVKPTLKRVTIADDIQKQMMQLQLMMGQQVSGTTAFKSLGLDWKKEQRQMGDEAAFQAAEQSQIQKEMQESGFAQQLAQGTSTTPGPGGAPTQMPPGGAPGSGQGQSQGGPQAGQQGQPGPVDQYLASMSPNTPVTPQDQSQTAQSIAQSLLGMPDITKDQQLRALKSKSPTMHSLVRSAIDKIRQNARSAGGAQMIAQQFGGGQGGGGGGQ